ncbi:MAG: LamG domain-containing protein, partial [Phycisphaerales bacterium]
MVLIGRIGHGDTTVALKYEQYENTGNYGATVFGVMDYDYGVATAPGEYTHLVFVSSETAGATELYVNGELVGSVPTAITLAGVVGIGQAIRDPEGAAFIDNFDGDIFGVAIYDRALTADEIAANADSYFSPIPITDPDMVLYLDFESGEGSMALDQSGHSNHGLLMGDPQWTTGILGGAMDFDGDGDFVDCGNSALLDITGDITVACWIKVDQFDKSWQAIVTHGDNSWRVHRSGSSNNIAWGTSGLSPTDLTGTVNVNDAEWHHVAGVYNGAQKLLYIDGALDASSDSTGNINSSNFNVNIGENNDATGRFFDGLIDEVRVYNRALTGVEIAMLVEKPYVEDFESYAVGTDLHGVNDWEGWQGAAGAGAPVSDAFALSGSNSVEIIGTADLVKKLDITGGQLTLTAMQYIPSGTSGDTFFIL